MRYQNEDGNMEELPDLMRKDDLHYLYAEPDLSSKSAFAVSGSFTFDGQDFNFKADLYDQTLEIANEYGDDVELDYGDEDVIFEALSNPDLYEDIDGLSDIVSVFPSDFHDVHVVDDPKYLTVEGSISVDDEHDIDFRTQNGQATDLSFTSMYSDGTEKHDAPPWFYQSSDINLGIEEEYDMFDPRIRSHFLEDGKAVIHFDLGQTHDGLKAIVTPDKTQILDEYGEEYPVPKETKDFITAAGQDMLSKEKQKEVIPPSLDKIRAQAIHQEKEKDTIER